LLILRGEAESAPSMAPLQPMRPFSLRLSPAVPHRQHDFRDPPLEGQQGLFWLERHRLDLRKRVLKGFALVLRLPDAV
jgi:hypothetical protein